MKYRCCMLLTSDDVSYKNIKLFDEKQFLEKQYTGSKLKIDYLKSHILNHAYFYLSLAENQSMYIGATSCKVMVDAENDITWLVIDCTRAVADYERVEAEQSVISQQSELLAVFTLAQLRGAVYRLEAGSLPLGSFFQAGEVGVQRPGYDKLDRRGRLSRCAISPVH